MWAVINTTPYAADRTWVQDREGNKIWLVVVKATYVIKGNGAICLADEQRLVCRMARYAGKVGESGLLEESDLLGVKPGTDLIVNGCAWTREGSRASWVDVQLGVAGTRKRLRVFGDRVWERSLVGLPSMSEPRPFASMPICYERAYGGWDRQARDPDDHRLDMRNPVGTGFATRAEHCFGRHLPNVEDPRQLISSWKDNPTPAGLGSVSCDWTSRRVMAGTYDANWQATRAPLWAADFDARYHHCAPVDQQFPQPLRGGEVVELVNLSREGVLSIRLPRVYLTFETRFGSRYVEHRAQLCTVLIEPDLSRFTMAWQTSMACNRRVDELDATIVKEKRLL